MVPSYNFKPYQPDQIEAVLQLWNSSELATLFPLPSRFWRENTELEPNFQPEDFTGAWDNNGQLAGFVLTRRFRETAASPAMIERLKDTGWISVLLVRADLRGQGLGKELLRRAEEQLSGFKTIRLGAEIGHFFPGVPQGQGEAFFEKADYQINPVNEEDLFLFTENWQPPALPEAVRNGTYFYTQGQLGEQEAILDFVSQPHNGYSPRWRHMLSRWFGLGYPAEAVTLLKEANGTIRGFLQTWELQHLPEGVACPLVYWASAEQPLRLAASIGPLGVDATVRGGGLGLGLVAAGTEYLIKKGAQLVTIDWTDLGAFYARLGYRSWRTYHYATKSL